MIRLNAPSIKGAFMQSGVYKILIIKEALIRRVVLKKKNLFKALWYARYLYQTPQHYLITWYFKVYESRYKWCGIRLHFFHHAKKSTNKNSCSEVQCSWSRETMKVRDSKTVNDELHNFHSLYKDKLFGRSIDLK